MPEMLRRALGYVVVLLLAFFAASLAMLASHLNPLGAFGALMSGAWGSEQGISETLAQTTTLLFLGLGVAVALQAGLFNIGAEGQLIVGGLCAAVAGARFDLPWPLEIPVCLLAGAVGGAAWAGIAGWLRARFGASEIITTIMLNYVAAAGASYLVTGPLRGSPTIPQTAEISASAILPPIVPNTRLTAAFVLALIAAIAVAWWLARTVAGFELRTVGRSERAARYAGIDVGKTLIRAMLVSGALAGVGGATEVMALVHRFNAELSPGFGFTAIAVALLAGANPLGTILTSLLFGTLQNGALAMQALAGAPKDIVAVVQGLVILFVAANVFARFGRNAKAEALTTVPAPADASA